MEGFAVLRAAQLGGVPALEVRTVSNLVDERDRSRWRFDEAFAALETTLTRLVAELGA
jgi:futalosine hydrolase